LAYSDYVVYVDESGDHGLTTIDPGYPVFVLSFCIFNKHDYTRAIIPSFVELKFRHFTHDMVVLHAHDIRKKIGPFSALTDPAFQAAFLADLNAAIAAAPFTLVAAVIDKTALLSKYTHPTNPYDIALQFCLERAYAALRDKGQHLARTPIIVESRGKKEDAALLLTFNVVVSGANHWGTLPFDIVFADKKTNSTGLQIADLVSRPIGTNFLRPTQPNVAFAVIQPKFRCSPSGVMHGYGRKVFP
jgi:hypothetical protein